MYYTLNNQRVEVYWVSIDDIDTRAKLKSLQYRWYPPKQCRTKRGSDWSILWIEKKESDNQKTDTEELDQCISCTDSQAERIKELEAKIKELEDWKKQKKERVSKKDQVSYFVPKKATLPILERYIVEDWMIRATDMERCIIKPTTLVDWVYKSIDPVILAKEEISDAPLLPQKIDFEVVASFEYDKETIEFIQYHIKESIRQWFVKNKNFNPLFVWRLIGAGAVFATDWKWLYLAESTKIDNPIYLLPYTSACVFLSIDTSKRSNWQKAIITLCSKDKTPVNNWYFWSTNWTFIFVEHEKTTMCSLLIKWMYPDYRKNHIIPDYEWTPVDISLLQNKLKIEKVEKTWIIELPAFTWATWHMKLLADWTRQQRWQSEHIFSKVDNVTRVFRPFIKA